MHIMRSVPIFSYSRSLARQWSGSPITIGASLSLSGDFSADGVAFERGYELWAADQNKAATDAANDMSKARADAAADIANAQYGVDKAKATAAYNVSAAQCEAQTGDAEKACKDKAKATYDAEVTAAENKKNAAHQ